MLMIVGVIGAGPAGSTLGIELGSSMILFDPSHPRDKPCGGGLTPKVYNAIDTPDRLVEARMRFAEISYDDISNTV